MLKPQFYATLIVSIVESLLFTWALLSHTFISQIVAIFLGVALLNNIYRAWRIEKIAKANGLFK